MPRYDFACERGHVFEEWVSRDVTSVPCASCGRRAARQLAVANVQAGAGAIAPKSERPLRIGAYQEAAQELDYLWTKKENEVGAPIQRPDYVSEAKKRATDVLAGKAPPPEGWTDPLQAR